MSQDTKQMPPPSSLYFEDKLYEKNKYSVEEDGKTASNPCGTKYL